MQPDAPSPEPSLPDRPTPWVTPGEEYESELQPSAGYLAGYRDGHKESEATYVELQSAHQQLVGFHKKLNQTVTLKDHIIKTREFERDNARLLVEVMRPVYDAAIALGQWKEADDPMQVRWGGLWDALEEAVANAS